MGGSILRPSPPVAAAGLALALGACALDPNAPLDDAALHLRVSGVAPGADRVLATLDGPSGLVERAAPVADGRVDLYFADLPAGRYVLQVEARGADGTRQCAVERPALTGRGEDVDVDLTRAPAECAQGPFGPDATPDDDAQRGRACEDKPGMGNGGGPAKCMDAGA